MAKNEDLFREVNDRIQSLSEGFSGDASEAVTFVCECSDAGCRAPVDLTLAEYARVRAHARWFVVAPGHVAPDHEHVARETARYVVVEKDGAAGEVAEDEA